MRLPFSLTEPLTTTRLVLRPFTAADADALLPIHADADAVRYVPYPPRDRAGVEEVLRRKVAGTSLVAEGDLLELAVVLPEEADPAGGPGAGALIGDVLLALRSVEHETIEVGYIFAAAHTGRGYASETVRALLDLAFGPIGARRVTARVDARNAASLRLLDRVGLRREAELVENAWFKGELSSEVDYALLSREWPTNHGGTGD